MNAELQTRIAAIKAECEKVIELDKLATAGPWGEIDGTMAPDAEFVIRARNVSPAMARVVLWSIRDAEMKCDNFLLRSIANQWEGK